MNEDYDDENFIEWLTRIPSFDLYGEELWLPSGDIPYDIEQMWQIYKRRHGENVDERNPGPVDDQ